MNSTSAPGVAPSISRCMRSGGHADLLIARHQQADEGGQLADGAQVKDEEREVAHGEGFLPHRLPGQDEDDAGADIGGVAEDGDREFH